MVRERSGTPGLDTALVLTVWV